MPLGESEPMAAPAAGPAAVQSMTGFASVDGMHGAVTFVLEARSVNNRSLDVRVRVPAGMDRHDGQIRRRATAAFRRGSLSLSLKRSEVRGRYVVNQDQLDAYMDAIQAMAASGSVAAPRGDGLLALRGVVEAAGEEDVELPAEAVVAATDEVLALLADDRRAEGARLVPVLAAQLAEMERIGTAIDVHPERALEAVKRRLDGQLAALLDGHGLDPARLHQEAALLATRADVREELDRLAAHVAAARGLIAEGVAVGRRLDFLAQELNREANTICSKAPHHQITALGLELKAAVEQFREQVQNIE